MTKTTAEATLFRKILSSPHHPRLGIVRVTKPRQTAKQRPARKTGRPTLYRSEYCRQVIDYMRAGHSLTAFAGQIEVCSDTIVEWQHAHPEFSLAVKKAKAARLGPLEKGLLECKGNPAKWIFALKNASPEEWRDKTEQQVSQTVTGLPEEVLERVRNILQKEARGES